MDPLRKLRASLLVRMAGVALAVSALVAVLVVEQERERVVDIAADRASIRVGTLRMLLLDRLDRGDLGDRSAVEHLLASAVRHDVTDRKTGRYVMLRVLSRGGREVGRFADGGHPGLAELARHVDGGSEPVATRDGEPEVAPVQVGDTGYVRARVPLEDTRGERVAWAEGYFAPTPSADAAARVRLLRAVGIAVGTVLLTTALLYPILLRLMRRLGDLSLRLLDSNLEMLQVIGSAIAKRDSDTDAHNYRVTIYAARLGEAVGLDDATMRSLIKGSLLHDVGKIGIRDAVLLKPGRLDAEEFAVMRRHVQHGLDIVKGSSWLADAAPIVGGHHEKYDGTGYFAKLVGVDIPIQARVFAVVDVFDAITSHRPYHEPMDFDGAMGVLEAGRGKHFDPAILDVFVEIAEPLHARYADRDDPELRSDHAAIVARYYRTDLTAFMA